MLIRVHVPDQLLLLLLHLQRLVHLGNQRQKILLLLLRLLLHIPYIPPHGLNIPLVTLLATVLWIQTNNRPGGPVVALHWDWHSKSRPREEGKWKLVRM